MGELVVPDYEPQALPPLSDAGAAGAAAGASSSDFAGMTPAKPTVTVLGRRVSATQFKAGVAVASGLLVLLVVASVSSAATGSGNGTVTGGGNDSAAGDSTILFCKSGLHPSRPPGGGSKTSPLLGNLLNHEVEVLKRGPLSHATIAYTPHKLCTLAEFAC